MGLVWEWVWFGNGFGLGMGLVCEWVWFGNGFGLGMGLVQKHFCLDGL